MVLGRWGIHCLFSHHLADIHNRDFSFGEDDACDDGGVDLRRGRRCRRSAQRAACARADDGGAGVRGERGQRTCALRVTAGAGVGDGARLVCVAGVSG